MTNFKDKCFICYEKTDQKNKRLMCCRCLIKNDLAILKLLQQNARITVKEISEKIHLSTTPVHERIKAPGTIRGDQAVYSPGDHTKSKKGLMVICLCIIERT